VKVLLLLAGLLAGCATSPRLPDAPADWAARQAALAAIERLSLEGRVAVNDGERSWQGQLFWQSDAAGFQARVFTPFGQTVAELHGVGPALELRLPDRPPLRDAEAQRLFSEEIGWQAPLAALHWWLIGLPDPSVASTAPAWNGDGRLAQIVQHGWTVRFTRYAERAGRSLPGRIEVVGPERALKLVIDRWHQP
jgi:outer membrane lipoprotein LolB